MLFAPTRLPRARRSVVLYFLRETRSVWIASTTNSSNNKENENSDDVKPPLQHRSYGKSLRNNTSKRSVISGRNKGKIKKNFVADLKDNSEMKAEENISMTSSKEVTELSSTLISSPSSSPTHPITDKKLELHRRLTSEMQQEGMREGETVSSGAANVAREKIERRRKKWALSEVEFDSGITERLFPEIRRLTALHEVHYGDATMREVDAVTYFSSIEKVHGATESKIVNDQVGAEMSLTDDDFLAFENQDRHNGEVVMTEASSSSGEKVKSEAADESILCSKDEEEKKKLPVCQNVKTENMIVAHGVSTPWFVPSGGSIRLEPIPPSDVLCLFRFVLHLRQQTPQQLPLNLSQRMKLTEALEIGEVKTRKSNYKPLSMEDVLLYLDTAPPPMLGFTENLPPSKSPAFIFVLYTENVSLQNAIGHMAALFSIPQRAFYTCTAVSKMSCGTVLCAVAPNHLQREHLLLLNTMRHPGFVLRVGSIRAVEDEKLSAELFGELARWQPLHEVELLLRRVSCGSREELEHRLGAVRAVGAVFFCANREASLARAATDVLHGFHKSALLNALHRRNAPLALRQFIARPNVIAAARARRATTDATVREALRSYIRTGGDWAAAVQRLPYVWRRRWLNALRCAVWNTMASRRLRIGGRRVLIGDVVLRPEFREDAQRRMLTTVKAEHVMIVRSEAEAAECSVEDVFIPFLRGVYPHELFASDETNHPIMTQANMLALLREAHAPQLLLGMSDACRQLLDVRSEASPLLFRRFIIRPITMNFTILEDKAPIKSIHFDAARILGNDRLSLQQSILPSITKKDDSLCFSSTVSTSTTVAAAVEGKKEEEESSMIELPSPSMLLKQSLILERTTIGARLSSGLLAEEFFSPPARDEYVALGHVKRHLQGNLVHASPNTPDEALKTIDRLFTVHIHAVVRNGVSALGHLLREYFILTGIEREEDSALQHKVHRIRRELDNETSRLTAPSFCQACYCRDHDVLDACAEYLFKRNRHIGSKRREEVLHQLAASDSLVLPHSNAQNGIILKNSILTNKEIKEGGNEVILQLDLHLRRRSEEQKWGVHLTSALYLSAIDDVSILAEGRVRFGGTLAGNSAAQRHFWKTWLLPKQDTSIEENDKELQLAALRQFITRAVTGMDSLSNDDDVISMSFSSSDDNLLLPRLHEVFTISSSTSSNVTSTSSEVSTPTDLCTLLRRCKWMLTSINNTAVSGRRQVAATFVGLGKQREVFLQFKSVVKNPVECYDSGVGNCQPYTLQRLLPPTLKLLLTKTHNNNNNNNNNQRKGEKKEGWGLKIDGDSLVVLNLSNLLQKNELSGVVATVNPKLTLTTKEEEESINGKYIVRSVNGISVSSQSDVVRSLQIKKRDGEMVETLLLQLELVLSKHEEESILTQCLPSVKVAKELSSLSGTVDSTNITSDSANVNAKASRVENESHKLSKDENNTIVNPEDHVGGKVPPPCSSQCTSLTTAQQKRSVVTIVVNRTAEAPVGKWGIRVQRGTLRLQCLQHNNNFSFQVYAAKQQQAVRIADTLRFNNIHRNKNNEEDLENETNLPSVSPAFYSHFVYMIIGVNYRRVFNADELRASLAAAAAAAHSSGEAVVLQVRQYRLAQIAVTIERDKVNGEDSMLEPVGLRLSREMVIESVSAGSPMARAIMTATNDDCSLRRLIREEPQTIKEGSNEKGKPLVTTLPGDVNSSKTSQWKFDLDEDTQQDSTQTTPTVEDVEGERDLTTTGSTLTLESYAYWNMVDGVTLAKVCGEDEKEAAGRFVWRVTYAVRAGPLRTPHDVARALAGDVKEETLFLQQCVVEE
ncbi:uncharacterized protein TM35_000012180 [Trypanosoma theileri]|uniref:Uncharacterized protein n=1 Tax=Trypanosoma theileri TaxID=67003 RepID=A0A1X0P930_9TRYP|nr:uncharacterized protein TM35_000012180 [Trypanosoma theileri]ORC93341.1 hypothetical protein TM35_000012180 [Trypanosoma theileri]